MTAFSLRDRLLERAGADGEFRLAARYWSGTLAIDLDGETIAFQLEDGVISAPSPPGPAADAGHVSISAPWEVWEKLLQPVPPPFFHDISPARAYGLRVSGDEETYWQYYPAVRRFIDLLREEYADASPV